MRILELYLKAFGPFTEKRLALDHAASGLHVIFGRNEAGKSSALRALRGLLYGIPGQTPDNFLHGYNQMRVGARLSDPSAGELSFLRKKGSKKTLRSFDDANTLADGAVAPFLHGVPEELFSRLFGIDHTELTQGSQSLLEEDGDLGQALFSAGLGAANVRGVLSALTEEADALFRPRASNPPVNAAIREFGEITRTIREKSLKGRDWKQQDRARETAERELADLSRELEQQRTAQTRLERIRSALAPLKRRRSLLAELEALVKVVELPDDFEVRLDAALEKKREATGVKARSQQEQDALRERLAGLQLDVAIADQRDAIEQLKQDIGTFKSAANDLPRREFERSQLEDNLVQGLAALRADLTPDGLGELRAPLARRGEIQELASEHAALGARIESASHTLREERETLETAQAKREKLSPPRDATPLRRTLQDARSLGDVDSRVNEAQRACAARARDCESGVLALGLWTGKLEELEGLPVPQLESIERFVDEFGALATQRERSNEAVENAEASIREYDLRLETLRRSGAAPMEAELAAERERRNTAWRLVRRRWIEDEPIDEEIAAFSGGEPLPELYERSIATADDVADRLRREADRVAEQASLEAQRKQAEEARDAAQQELTRLESEVPTLQGRWQALWQPAAITPHPPREMLAWLRRQGLLVDSAAALRGKRDELEALDARRAEACMAVLSALQPLDPEAEAAGDELALLLARAEEVAEEIETTEAGRVRLDEAIADCEKTVRRAAETQRTAQARQETWSGEWTAAVSGLGLADGARPAAALDRLETANELLERRREIEGLDTRIDGMRRDIERITRDVDAFVAAHAPELAGLRLEERVRSLGQRLSEVERQETLRAEISKQITAQEESSKQATRALAEARHEFESLGEVAQCAEEAELEPALRRWQKKQKLASDLAAVEEQLADTGAGTPLAQLEAEAGEIDRDSLPGQIEGYDEHIAELETRRSDAMAAHAAAQAELKRMDGSPAAAEAASSAQATAARLRRDVERYVQLRLAHSILQREIERYREIHQSPVLERASKLFADLTMGSFAGLQSDYDDEECPMLIGMRPNDQKLEVHEMSSGTRDQLYLALRLATIEEWVERSGPMPFVMDDILVNFDDDRARATLEVLAQLGAKTQALLFTHHGRDRQHAGELGIPVLDLEAS